MDEVKRIGGLILNQDVSFSLSLKVLVPLEEEGSAKWNKKKKIEKEEEEEEEAC